MSFYESTELLGFKVFSSSLEKLKLNSKLLINTINQYSYIIAEKDIEFKRALTSSDILLPDGVGIVAASRFLTGNRINKIAGADIHDYLLKQLQYSGGKCMYLGSSQNTLNKIKERISMEYPNIQVAFFSPPYKSEFSEDDNRVMVDVVNLFKPDVLFVGMTAPKQEKWAYKHKDLLNTNIVCSIGAVFDFYAGTVQRPSNIWISFGFEWLGRLVKEPKRMWKRYLYYGPVFGYRLAIAKIKQAL